MRFVWVCLLCVSVYAKIQKPQIVQTYIYPANQNDFTQEVKNGQTEITIRSQGLLDFMTSNELKGKLERQLVRVNAGYTEFKSSDQMIHTYSNSSNSKLRFNLTYHIYELEYLGGANYKIRNIDGLIDEDRQCDFVIQKTLTNAIDAKKDFVINLDNSYFFSSVLATHRFLQCMRK